MANKINLHNEYPNITKSKELINRAKGLIPSLTQTLAKGPTQWSDGVAPKYLESGKGAIVYDVDGNEYIDYNMGIGPIVLGYCYEAVDKAIIEQLEKGITFSLMHPLEVEVAELIREVVPNAESVRYSKTGCDVTSAAIRIARAYTGREKVLCCGYHGWHDWYISVTDLNKGIPEVFKDFTYTFIYNDINSVKEALDKDIACVILEPVIFDKPENNFLQELRDLCTRNGSLLIFDEMWTGFRMALGGAQEYFKVTPDLATFSKAIANGMPISVITGKYEFMKVLEEEVFFYTTFGGETLSLAAAKATINEIRNKNVCQHLQKQGEKIQNGFNSLAQEFEMDYVKCVGYPFRSIITFNPEIANPLEMKTFVQQEMIKRGVLWGGFHNMCFSHTDEQIEYTLNAYKEVLPLLKSAVESGNLQKELRGKILKPVFRKTTNFKKTNL